jgi:hypothetical protein
VAAAERLDDALAKVFSAFQGPRDGQAHMQAFNDWSDAWVATSCPAVGKRVMSPTAAITAAAVPTSTPGIVKSRANPGNAKPAGRSPGPGR